jgi:ABC-type transporter MlaC component
MGKKVDQAILQINRGAEDAVGYAKPIFLDAIKEMTLTEAINIVKGTRDAATNYFRQKTTQKLITAFLPVIKSSLDKVDATKYYTDMVTTYNNFPATFKKINPDLPSYVAGKSVDALFDQIAKEEANIRANPVARTTEMLKKVFGGMIK